MQKLLGLRTVTSSLDDIFQGDPLEKALELENKKETETIENKLDVKNETKKTRSCSQKEINC